MIFAFLFLLCFFQKMKENCIFYFKKFLKEFFAKNFCKKRKIFSKKKKLQSWVAPALIRM